MSRPSPFLSVPELAALLQVNEKKIYQLAGRGDLPGTKITGKWIFPRRLIDDWILENSHGGVLSDRLLLVGCDDPLLQMVCRQAALDWQREALLSFAPAGTRHGLRMLDAGRADACFINWGASEPARRRHLGLLRGYRQSRHWVLVPCLARSQGLMMTNALAQRHSLAAAEAITAFASTGLRWVIAAEDTAHRRLLEDYLPSPLQRHELIDSAHVAASDHAAAALIVRGLADIGCGLATTARDHGLVFLPLASVSVDLVTTRRTYFRSALQALLGRLRDSPAMALAAALEGHRLPDRHEVLAVADTAGPAEDGLEAP